MAARFFTKSPSALLKAFDEKISQTEREGSITTWVKTSKGNYTHVSPQWGRKAFFKANSDLPDRLVFNVIPPEGEIVEHEVYAFYHGHLIATFISHFAEKFTVGAAGAKPTSQDRLISKSA